MSRTDDNSHEGFVSRWSRRKSVARSQNDGKASASAAPETESAGPAVHTTPPMDGAQLPTVPDATTAADSGDQNDAVATPLPDIDSLNEESDYSAFMAPDVSSELRNLALRKLFKSAVFNVRDGLDDYDEDFTTFEKLGDIVTADMRHHIERKQQLANAEHDEQDNSVGPPADAGDTQTPDGDEPVVAADMDQPGGDEQVVAGDMQQPDGDEQVVAGSEKSKPAATTASRQHADSRTRPQHAKLRPSSDPT